jgi:protein-export membrane protein SecD
MLKYRIGSLILIILAVFCGFFLSSSQKQGARFPFKFGLDLIGGTELVYKADTSLIAPADIGGSMNTLRDVIERRVNIFGVSEPIVQVEEAGIITGNRDHRLIVELPGVTDIDKAVAMIGKTPILEFRLEKDGIQNMSKQQLASSSPQELFVSTGITGRLLKNAQLQFDNTTHKPMVILNFNDEGTALFAKVTKENIGKTLAIFLDGQLIEAPVIRDAITSGNAQITGAFDANSAKAVVTQLNYGALPVPVELVSSQTIGASLGSVALHAGLKAGLVGFALIVAFLILWYRLPGIIASIALILYVLMSLSLFLLIPVTLTAAGLAGFILSIGMAVDANVLIFERMKEELRAGKEIEEAIKEGFHRAWLSIRDSNISSIITAIVLFWLGTSAVKGFALTLGLGVMVSMFTAITASRSFLFATRIKKTNALTRFLYGSGTHNS